MDKTARILITGGTGFVGSHFLEYLLDEGYQNIHLTSYSSPEPFFIDRLSLDLIHQIDLTDIQATEQLIARIKPTVVIHLASLAAVGASFANALEVLQNNISLQLSVLNAIEKHARDARILAVTSAEVYGMSLATETTISEAHPLRPVSPYAASKASQDLLTASYYYSKGLDIVRARPFNHIGERQTPQFVVPAFAQQIVAIERGQQDTLSVGNLSAIRDFTDVKDMVRAYAVLLDQGVAGEAYNCGTGVGVSIQSVLDQLTALATVPISVTKDPKRQRPHDIASSVADPTKLTSLGWQPSIPLSDTLNRVLAYWRSQ